MTAFIEIYIISYVTGIISENVKRRKERISAIAPACQKAVKASEEKPTGAVLAGNPEKVEKIAEPEMIEGPVAEVSGDVSEKTENNPGEEPGEMVRVCLCSP